MIIAVMQFSRKTGATTLSLLLANEFSLRNKLTCVTNLNAYDKSFINYLSLRDSDDIYERIISSHNILLKMLENSTIKTTEMRDYCYKINNDFDIFYNKESCQKEELKKLLDGFIKYFPHEVKIIDLDYEYDIFDHENIEQDIEYLESILSNVDIVVVSVDTTFKSFEPFFVDKKKEIIKEFLNNKKVVVVVNNYEQVINIKEFNKLVKFDEDLSFIKGIYFVRHNEYIQRVEFLGDMISLFKAYAINDYRLLNLKIDISKLVEGINKLYRTR